MSDDIYDDVIRIVSERMKTNRAEMTVVIYESADCVRDHDFRTNTHQPLQHTGSDSVKITSCLALLCVLLLTAVIVLCVHIHTKSTNYTEERNELLTKITNLTEERGELIIKYRNVSNERDQLINQLSFLGKEDEWIYYKFSFYYMSNETKNWAESRQDCLKRGADLIIINNTEENDFVKKITDKREFWIGVTDSDVEDRWKWVDGSILTSGSWASGEPNGGRIENCAVTYLKKHPELIGCIDVRCNGADQWVCEKRILPLIRP